MMLKDGLIHLTMTIMIKDLLQWVRIKKDWIFFKNELRGNIMTEVCALRSKTWAYKMDDDSERKKAKGTKKAVIKRLIMYENYAYCFFNDATILRS